MRENDMLIEIFYMQNLYARFKIDFDTNSLEIIEEPNKEIRFINSSFEHADGFRFDFETVRNYLKCRNIDKNTKTGVYYNVNSDTKIVVIRKERI